MNGIIHPPEQKWETLLKGFKLISGSDWQTTASYDNFWPLHEKLYHLAGGIELNLPGIYKPSLTYILGAHAGRKRKGLRGRPYWHHISMVLLYSWVINLPLDWQLAAIHHDDIEDLPKHLRTNIERIEYDIEKMANGNTLAIVKLLTNEKVDKTFKHQSQLKHMAAYDKNTQKLKMGDRICNLFDMRYDKPTKGFTPERIQEECLKAQELAAVCGDNLSLDTLHILELVIRTLAKENNFDPYAISA